MPTSGLLALAQGQSPWKREALARARAGICLVHALSWVGRGASVWGDTTKMRPTFPRRCIRPALFVVLAITLGVLIVERSRDEGALELHEVSLGPPFQTPLVSVRHRPGREGGPVALLVHGYQCNKSMMLQLAKFLALNGIDSYVIDLPGHGASTDTYADAKAPQATAQALWHLIVRERIAKDRIALVGHSYGAMIVSFIGIADRGFHSHVLIGPGYVEGFTLDAPENVLILLAERDHSYVKEFAYRLLKEGTAGRGAAPSQLFGSYEGGDARLLEIVPDVAHVSLMWSAYVFDRTRAWIEETVGESAAAGGEARGRGGTARSLWIAALSIALATLVVFELAQRLPAARRNPARPLPARAYLILPLAAAGGVAVTRLFVPLMILGLHEGAVLASVLLNSGVAMVALAGFAMWRIRSLEARELPLELLLAVLAAIVVYASASLSVTPQFYYLTFSGFTRRALIFLILFLAFLPYFCVAEAFFRSIQTRFRSAYLGGAVSLAASLGFTFLVLASIRFLDPMLRRFVMPLVALILYAQFVGAVFHRRRQSWLAGGVFSSLLVAWGIAVGFLVTEVPHQE